MSRFSGPIHQPAKVTIILYALSAKLDAASRWFALVAVFALPISTALCGGASLAFIACWLLGGRYRAKLAILRAHPLTPWALALFALLVVGVFYSTAPWSLALHTLRDYRELLYLPLLLTVFAEAQWRCRAYRAFLAAMALTVVVSYLRLLGIIPPGAAGREYTAFKSPITHGVLLAFALYLFAAQYRLQSHWRWLWAGLFLLGATNLLLLNNSRTGYILFFALLLLFMFQHWRWRGALAAIALGAAIAVGAYGGSAAFSLRTHQVLTDITETQSVVTSGGLRLAFYRHTLDLIASHPWFGGGTGSFAQEYAKLADTASAYATTNPHNEYLLVTTQLGLTGLALLLALGLRQWRWSLALEPTRRHAAQALMITMAIGCLFNSLLLDFTEGHFYAYLSAILYGGLGAGSSIAYLDKPLL
ncbi:MAG: O-antigen ligase family protein [Gammaproteobacteria bacterium]